MPEPPASFPELTEPARRQGRRTARGTALRWLLRGLFGALLLVLIGQLIRGGWNHAAAPPAKPVSEKIDKPIRALDPAKSPSLQPRAWEQDVVAIQSRERRGKQSHGSGFLVAGTNLVATNLHVSAACTEAVVRLADGTTYEVEGYAAVDSAHDLALLKLKDAPAHMNGLKLGEDADPPRRREVWAVGHPDGIEFTTSHGEVSGVLTTDDLPQLSQRFLRDLLNSSLLSEETRWIQHSATIAPGSSGGPLVDGEGRVLGINTWVDQSARFHYALHVRHLRALLEKIDKNIEPLAEHATAEARMNQALWELSTSRLQSLLEQGRGMKWQPQTERDYRVLQQLAWAITIARRPDALAVRGSLGKQLDELAKGADAAAERLREEKWNEPGQVTILNEHAATELRRPMAGLFLFATIERIVAGEDGRRGLIAALAGFDEPLFLPLEDQLNPPEAGAQVLVLGVNYQGHVVQWGNNPLKLTSAPIIVPGLMIELK